MGGRKTERRPLYLRWSPWILRAESSFRIFTPISSSADSCAALIPSSPPPSFAAGSSLLGWVSLSHPSSPLPPPLPSVSLSNRPRQKTCQPLSLSLSSLLRRGWWTKGRRGGRESYFFSRAPRRRRSDDDFCDDFAWKINTLRPRSSKPSNDFSRPLPPPPPDLSLLAPLAMIFRTCWGFEGEK